MYYFKKDGINKIDFRKSGLLEKKCFNAIDFETSHNVIKSIKDSLNNNYYLIVMLNQKYFKNLKVCTREEYVRDWLIFGYDDETKQFLCSSYIHGSIKIIKLSYDEVEIALTNVPSKYIFSSPSYFRNHLVKINTNYNCSEINDKFIIKRIRRMFFPKHLARDGFWHLTVGLNTFFRLSKNLKKSYKRNNKPYPIFIQNIRIMYDFRQNVLLCLQKLNADKKTLTEYEKIKKQTYNILLMAYKYNCNMNKDNLLIICNNIDLLNKAEKKILKKYI